MPCNPRLVAILAICSEAMLSVGATQAQLRFCNKTATKVQLIVASPEADKWYAEGWFSLAPQECGLTVSGNLANRYYYYHAEDSDTPRRVWRGDAKFCVGDGPFRVLDAPVCEGGSLGFRKLDTGTATSYTLNLERNDSEIFDFIRDSNSKNVIRVPSTRPAPPPLARWKDPATGLTWRTHSNDSGSMDLKNAKAFCDELSYGGYDDWRLPTIVELATLVDSSSSSSCKIKANFELRGCMVWSSSMGGPGEGWLMLFSDGTRDTREIDGANGVALCVRG